ncbi:MAG: family 16 glycosylhydrolase, partial [Microthrixaceae bacterium]
VTSVHWTRTGCGGGCDKSAALTEFPPDQPATEFHTYRMEWTPQRMEFWVDGNSVMTLGGETSPGWSSAAPDPSVDSLVFPAPFDESNEMYLLLNLAVGGNWPGPPGPETPFPATMEVDWVRVFRQQQ